MFFSCSSCGTRLQLPDEQVHHRVLTIRCTACNQVMTVRDPTGRHARPVDAWFVTVGGQQRGPLHLNEMEALVREGRVDARSYAWYEGLGQWTRAGEIAALARLFAEKLLADEKREEASPKADAEAEAKALVEGVAAARAQAEADLHAREKAAAREKAEREAAAAAKIAAEHAAVKAAELKRLQMAIGDTPLPVAGSALVVKPAEGGPASADVWEHDEAARHERGKKRWLWLGLVLVAALILVIALLNGPLARAPAGVDMGEITTQPKKPYEAAVRTEAAPREAAPARVDPPADAAVAADAGEAAAAEVAPAPLPEKSAGADKRSEKLALVIPSPSSDGGKLDPSEVDKSEAKIVFDPGAAARDQAAADQAASDAALREEVNQVFRQKKTQFAKCSRGAQEKLKVVFTVAPYGKVVDPDVSGSDNALKLRCIRDILARSIFPDDGTAQTYSQTLVL